MGSGLDVIIVGGSLAGLMSGITLKHTGHNVFIYERDFDLRESHMAGIAVGADAQKFLEQHDRLKATISRPCTGLNIMQKSNMVRHLPAKAQLTSWNTLYYLLRANFDGYTGAYFPGAPIADTSDGSATFLSRHIVLDIQRKLESGKMTVRAQNRDTQEISERSADFVIGADGPSSTVRAKYLPSCQRRYTGSITWRALVPESELSPETLQVFEDNASILLLDWSHIVVYMVPGAAGSLEVGKRLVNVVWYDSETPSALDEILVDGVDSSSRHHYTVPEGHVRQDIWQNRVRRAERLPFAPPFLELIQKIRRPFIQVLTECRSPAVSFEDDGKVLLVGDAACLNRPDTAFSCSQAAFHATRLEQYIGGRLTRDRWDETIGRFSLLHWSQAEWFGKYYQDRRPVAWLAFLVHRWYCYADKFAAWWYGEEPLLRNYAAASK